MDVLVERIEGIATDLGRLRRTWGESFILDSVCNQVESCDALVRRTAADWCRLGWPVAEALALVDVEAAECRRRLGR